MPIHGHFNLEQVIKNCMPPMVFRLHIHREYIVQWPVAVRGVKRAAYQLIPRIFCGVLNEKKKEYKKKQKIVINNSVNNEKSGERIPSLTSTLLAK